MVISPGGLIRGANPGPANTGTYEGEVTSTGTLHNVTVAVSGDLLVDTEVAVQVAIVRQQLPAVTPTVALSFPSR